MYNRLCFQIPANQTESNLGMECFQDGHWFYVVPAAVLFVLFIGLCARLMRVGGELQNIELNWRNPLDWRGDCKKIMPYQHVLSAAKPEHASGTVVVKTVAVLAATYMGTKHPTVVAVVRAPSRHGACTFDGDCSVLSRRKQFVH